MGPRAWNLFSSLFVLYGTSLSWLLSLLYNTNILAPPVEFEPVIPASERPQTLALDRSTNGIGAFIIKRGKHEKNRKLK